MEIDKQTIDTLAAASFDSRQPRLLIYTSGVWVYGNTGDEAVDETAELRPPALVSPRAENEKAVLQENRNNLRTIIIRPGCVYGESGSLTASWFASATSSGAAAIVAV